VYGVCPPRPAIDFDDDLIEDFQKEPTVAVFATKADSNGFRVYGNRG
jgi:hypothetical protein